MREETDLRRERGWNLLTEKNVTLCWNMCAECTPIPHHNVKENEDHPVEDDLSEYRICFARLFSSQGAIVAAGLIKRALVINVEFARQCGYQAYQVTLSVRGCKKHQRLEGFLARV